MLKASPKTFWSQTEVLPKINSSAHIAEAASVIGSVTISAGVMVCPGASIRGDEGMPIFIGEDSNIQDGAVLHGLMNKRKVVQGNEYSIYVGNRVSCGHCCVVHGPCVIHDDTFIGFNAVVIGSEIDEHVYIGHGAQVVGVHIAAGRYVEHGTSVLTQAQADALPEIPIAIRDFNAEVVEKNTELARTY